MRNRSIGHNCTVTGFGALLLLLQTVSAHADIRKIQGTDICLNPECHTTFPIVQGETHVATVTGSATGTATSVEVVEPAAGVTVSKPAVTNPALPLPITIVASATATPGERTVRIHYAVELNGPDTFKVMVVRKGTVTAVEFNRQSPSFFQTALVKFKGQMLGNAQVSLARSEPPGATAEVSSSTEAETVVTVRFPTTVAYAKANVRIFDRNLSASPSSGLANFSSYPARFFYNGMAGTDIEVAGPNAVRAISFPLIGGCGPDCFNVGDTVTAQIDLMAPARRPLDLQPGQNPSPRQSLSPGAITIPGQQLAWTLSPPNKFRRASTPYDGNGAFNFIAVPYGDSSKRIDFTIAQCPGPGEQVQATIQTWVGSTNTTQAPGFKQRTFTVRCGK